MEILSGVVNFVLSLGGAVFLPFMIAIMGMFFKMKFSESFKNGLRIGTGLIGIDLVIGTLVGALSPAVSYYSDMGSGFVATDIGWEGISAIAWSTPFSIAIVPLGMILNYILIRTKFTKTMDVDVWNYWHFILTAAMVYYLGIRMNLGVVVSAVLGIVLALVTLAIILKCGDWIAPYWQEYYDLPGTTCCNSDAYCIWLVNWIVCKVMDLIPGLNKIKINSKTLSDKFGAFGDSGVITFFCGLLLAAVTRCDVKTALKMAVTLTACIILVPKTVALLMEGLVPISNEARKYFKNKLGDDYDIYIGMDEALCLGDEVGIEIAVIMIPFALALAFVPGVNFFPVASLGSLCYTTCACALFAKGDFLKTFISSLVMTLVFFELKSVMAPLATMLAVESGSVTSAAGLITGSGVWELQNVIVGLITKLLGAW
jgi:PTS system galactitol-specific IIC component